MLAVLLCALLAQDPVAAGVQDVTQLTLSAPRTITVVDTGKIPGSPVRLAWGPDGSLYVRVTDTDRWGNERSRHFVAMPTEKTTLAPTDGEPPWVPVYWTSKASTVAPGVPTMKLDVEQRRERNRIINAPSGGELAGTASAALPPGGGQGVSQGAAVAAANSAVTVDVVTLRLKGHVIAEWSGTTPQPATQLSWAPSPMGVLAYVDDKKHLLLIDRDGHKREVAGAMDVVLPAWSLDGKRIAYLQKMDKKKYALTVIEVGR